MAYLNCARHIMLDADMRVDPDRLWWCVGSLSPLASENWIESRGVWINCTEYFQQFERFRNQPLGNVPKLSLSNKYIIVLIDLSTKDDIVPKPVYSHLCWHSQHCSAGGFL